MAESGSEKDDTILKKYYSLRSGEYDLLYEKVDRQEDLAGMRELLISVLEGKNVLEVACGTGYWTEVLADHVETLHAIDTSMEMIEVARKRVSRKGNITFSLHDAYSLEDLEGDFDAAFCGYWISHVHRDRMKPFIDSLNARLERGSVVALLDNRLVGRSVTPISRTDARGNTFQLRKLLDGREFEIVKNFLTRDELESLISDTGRDSRYVDFQYYWLFYYHVA